MDGEEEEGGRNLFICSVEKQVNHIFYTYSYLLLQFMFTGYLGERNSL